MTRGTTNYQRELSGKGYHCVLAVSKQDATDKAKTFRSAGKKAQALECATSVKGIYSYCVYVK